MNVDRATLFFWLGNKDLNLNWLIQNQLFCRLNYSPSASVFVAVDLGNDEKYSMDLFGWQIRGYLRVYSLTLTPRPPGVRIEPRPTILTILFASPLA